MNARRKTLTSLLAACCTAFAACGDGASGGGSGPQDSGPRDEGTTDDGRPGDRGTTDVSDPSDGFFDANDTGALEPLFWVARIGGQTTYAPYLGGTPGDNPNPPPDLPGAQVQVIPGRQ
ncbi:MAG: hypothetical protein HY897_01225 [Deltaproteobacteria bacterium]|nr:hypothetical protein [Deltaproteobacteria bacterium]